MSETLEFFDESRGIHVEIGTTEFNTDRFTGRIQTDKLGDIVAPIPMRARSKGRTEMGASQKCGDVFGPAISVVVSGAVLDWEFGGWLDWDPDAKGFEHGFRI